MDKWRAVLIYDLAKQHLVEELKYPPGLANMEYDKHWAIMVRGEKISIFLSILLTAFYTIQIRAR